jgi:membrane protease YdiL (CAAX protease family)
VPLGIGYSFALRLALVFVLAGVVTFLLATGTATPETLRKFVTTHQPDVTTLVDLSAMRENPAYFWLTVTFVSFIVAGLREELWRSAFIAGLRVLWPQTFGSRIGQIGAVAMAAVLFGLGHLQLGPFGMLFAGILGFGLGLIMVLHRSVWPAVIAHGLFDATTLALLPWVMEKLHS